MALLWIVVAFWFGGVVCTSLCVQIMLRVIRDALPSPTSPLQIAGQAILNIVLWPIMLLKMAANPEALGITVSGGSRYQPIMPEPPKSEPCGLCSLKEAGTIKFSTPLCAVCQSRANAVLERFTTGPKACQVCAADSAGHTEIDLCERCYPLVQVAIDRIQVAPETVQ